MSKHKSKSWRKHKEVKFGRSFWIIIFFLTIYFLGNVWQSVSINRLNRQNSNLRTEYNTLEKEYSLLVQEFEKKRQLSRVLDKLQGEKEIVPVEVIHLFID